MLEHHTGSTMVNMVWIQEIYQVNPNPACVIALSIRGATRARKTVVEGRNLARSQRPSDKQDAMRFETNAHLSVCVQQSCVSIAALACLPQNPITVSFRATQAMVTVPPSSLCCIRCDAVTGVRVRVALRLPRNHHRRLSATHAVSLFAAVDKSLL
jgi:hypothetical protein